MDLVSIAQHDKKVSLLSLPRFDMMATTTNSSDYNQENEATPPARRAGIELVLMQLPFGVAISELASRSYFLAPRGNTLSLSEASSSCLGNSRQARLVIESKKQSFSVNRLETSNVLVLVPPVDAINKETQTNVTKDKEGEWPALKKAKVSEVLLPARLLEPGCSGASFLELHPKKLRTGDLGKLLQKHVFDPYNKNCYRKVAGRSLSGLAHELLCSIGQVEDAMKILRGFPMPQFSVENGGSSEAAQYGVLSDEVLREAQNAMISTLAESDIFADYAYTGVNVANFMEQVMERMTVDRHVLHFAITTLLKADPGKDNDLPLQVDASTHQVQLDVKKIAVLLAHRLFQIQTGPWEESRFCVRWQSELPGVGAAYTVNLDWLKGVAFCVQDSSVSRHRVNAGNEKRFWRYFPSNKLPSDGKKLFDALFALQDQWTSEDLEPYLDCLVKETGLLPVEILLRYTTQTPPKKGNHGKEVKLYSLKR